MTLEEIENINIRLDYIFQIIADGSKYGLSRTEKSIIELCKIIRDILNSEKIREENAQLRSQMTAMLESESQ